MGDPANNPNRYPYPIKTVVVLVQENRSFDHMVGYMKQLNPNINGVLSPGEYSNPVDTSDPDSKRVYFGDGAVDVDSHDPGHEIGDIYEQVFGEAWSKESSKNKVPQEPTMQGFAQNANRVNVGVDQNVMNGFKPEQVPVFKELVTQYAIGDRWFSSVPAATQPNRLYVNSATSYGLTDNDSKMLIHGFPQKTIFESLDEAGLTFGIYYQMLPSTLYYKNLRALKYLKCFHYFGFNFMKHCKEGTLPNYVFIEPKYFDLPLNRANDDHPPHDVSRGQAFVSQVYSALRKSPQWEEMLFIVTYDEHGGYFDHVPTPVKGVPSPDQKVGPEPHCFGFDRLGVRVPIFFISPFIEPGTVLHGASGPEATSEYEHSSIPATLKKIFNLENFLTRRDAWAGTFEGLLTRNTPRTDCPETLPDPEEERETPSQEDKKLSHFQIELVQLAACLRGEGMKETFPDKRVENMTVKEGWQYAEEALKIYFNEYDNARKRGDDDSSFVTVKPQP